MSTQTAVKRINNTHEFRFSSLPLILVSASFLFFFFFFFVPENGILQSSSSWKLSINVGITEAPWPWISPQDNQDKVLEAVLSKAAMKNKTVILTTLNKAWATPGSILDLFLESFQIGEQTSGLLNHLVIICLDQTALERCKSVHRHCFFLTTKGIDFSAEKLFRTADYLRMMWRRIRFLQTVLELGFDFVFTDADIMWFRSPFPQFHPDADFQIACDRFMGNSSDTSNWVNGGFEYVKSNIRTVRFYEFWYNSGKQYSGKHDQDVLDIVKKGNFVDEIGLKMKFLDTAYFGGFCEPSKDMNKVCTMHANCCVGLQSKIHALRLILDDWKNFINLSTMERRSKKLAWKAPKKCTV